MATATVAQGQTSEGTFFGHPKPLFTLFGAELFERFSYYGMRALLILYMTAPVARGGLGFDALTAGSVYALYTSLVYFLGLPGGWLADRFIGQRMSVLLGGIIIMLGHFSLAIDSLVFFGLGLVFLVIGTGLLKPNISAMVGGLYSKDEPEKRDAGFTIFYLGINIGGFAGPLISGWLGETVSWHLGFASAGIAMFFGLLMYIWNWKSIAHLGSEPTHSLHHFLFVKQKMAFFAVVGVSLLIVAGALTLHDRGLLNFTLADVVYVFKYIILGTPFLFLASSLIGCETWEDRKHMIAVFLFFLGAVVFWGAFEQQGSTLTLFIRDSVDLSVSNPVGQWFLSLVGIDPTTAGSLIPVSWFNSLNPLFIFLLAPLFALLWQSLKRFNPSTPVKFGFGLLFVSLSFWILQSSAANDAPGVALADSSRHTTLLIAFVYLVQTIGEMFLSPVGLSTVSKLAPNRYTSQAMSMWFLAPAVANFLAGMAATEVGTRSYSNIFGDSMWLALITGIIMLVLSPVIKRLMTNVR